MQLRCLTTVVLMTVQTTVNCASLQRVSSADVYLPANTASFHPSEFLKHYGYLTEDHVAITRGCRGRKLSDFKWTSKTVTRKPKRFLSKMSVDTQCLLTLTYTPLNADVVVGFWSREHGDGSGNAFDGRGPLLAHAFAPGDEPLSGDIHFDADEPWSYGSRSEKTKDLLMVAVHEVGHALGLNPSLSKKDIMYPVYGDVTETPNLSENDVKRLQSLYGRNPSFRWKPPLKTPAPDTTFATEKATPNWCRMPFNDIMRGPYGYGYVFSRSSVYRFDSKGVNAGYPVHVNKVFPGAPVNPLAVVHVREGMRTYFFKGKKLWRFSGFTLDPGYPIPLPSQPPEKPRAAINILDRKGRDTVYIFGTKFFWQWNPDKEDVSSSYLYITSFWRGLPPVIDAAVCWSDGFLYFFRHNKYYKVSPHTYKLKEGYPKVKGPAWLQGNCGYAPK